VKNGEEETGEEETIGVENIGSVALEVIVGVAILKGEQLLWTCGKLSACFGQGFEEGLFNFVIY
jgi:hypothetical protein